MYPMVGRFRRNHKWDYLLLIYWKASYSGADLEGITNGVICIASYGGGELERITNRSICDETLWWAIFDRELKY